jgi:hypothetical protein
MRPFAYSVTPQQTETLTISTAPAIGSQTVAAPEPINVGLGQWPAMQVTKYSDGYENNEPTQSAGTQSAGTQSAGTPSPSPTKKHITNTEYQPIQSTIYDLYENFADHYVKPSLTRPNKDDVLPGTIIKLWGGYYYYIDKNNTVCKNAKCKNAKCKNAKEAYYDFCKALFTKGQAGLLGSAVQQGLAAPLAVPSR